MFRVGTIMRDAEMSLRSKQKGSVTKTVVWKSMHNAHLVASTFICTEDVVNKFGGFCFCNVALVIFLHFCKYS